MAAKILVCDDANFMRFMMKDLLASAGYEIAGEAENGAQAIERYKELNPDIVLMDITMPVMDGLTALKEIMKIDRSAKVIMVSALGQSEWVAESMKNGAKDFIMKPYKADAVIRTIEKVLK